MNILVRNRDDFILGILILQTIPNLGPIRIKKLIQTLGGPLEIFKKSDEEIKNVTGINSSILQSIREKANIKQAEYYFKQLKNSSIQVTHFYEDSYPSRLRHIPDAPPLLFYLGDNRVLEEPSLVIVGTRKPTPYGAKVAQKFAREISEYRIPIISGLARGIDTIAHETALQCGNKTIAVLASGLDFIYPPENKDIARNIINNGALVSEFPPGIKPEPAYFSRRNRIISGLSDGIIVVEAGKNSGALITANYGLEQNREIFAVPGEITNPQAAGCLTLIQEGAKCILSFEDILDELPHLAKRPVVQQKTLILLDKFQQFVLENISYQPVHIDALQKATKLSIARLENILFDLEMEGYIQQLPGKMYIRN